MATLVAGEALIHGRFRRESLAGRGSFGRVLEVTDTTKNQLRALKIIPRGPHEGTLLDEFEQLARLRHPSLPRVFEVGRTREPIDELPAGAPFFVAEWIAGTRADGKTWTAAALWSLLADLAGALATIHAAGLVHADVAPQNVLCTDERAVLVDLGLAAAANTGGARGTPAYMAPEAFAGHVEPRSDLYSLGALAVRLVTGRPPIEAPSFGELVQRAIAGIAPPPLPGIPRPLADLIGRLLRREPDARPASALAVLDELDQIAPAIEGVTRRARPKVTPPPSPASWPGAATWIDRLTSALAGDRVTVVVGPPPSGARQLVDAALRARQLADVATGRSPSPVIAGDLDAIAAQLSIAGPADPARGARSFVERIARAIRDAAQLGIAETSHAGREPGMSPAGRPGASGAFGPSLDTLSPPETGASRQRFVLELGDDPRAPDLIAALARIGSAAAAIVIVDQLPESLAVRRDLAIVRAPVLDVDGVGALAHSMLGAVPPRPWVQALLAAGGGMPLTTVELLRSIADEKDPFAVDWASRATTGAIELRTRVLQRASIGARRLATAVAVWGGRTRLDRALVTARLVEHDPAEDSKAGASEVGLAHAIELERLGLAQRRRLGEVDELAIDRSTRDAVLADPLATALAGAVVAALGERAVRQDDAARARGEQLGEGAIGAARVAELAPIFELAHLDARSGALACVTADALLAGGRADRALAIAKRAIASVPARAGLIAARAAAASGAYREATELSRAAAAAGADPVEAELVIARAAQRAAALDDAEATLARLHTAHPTHAEVAGTYARLLVTRSRYADARQIATADALGPLAGLRAEAAGLASFYLGELSEADAAFAALELSATAGGDGATVGRALSLRGMVAQQRGQLGLASERYQEAARRLHEAGELHAAAVAELNLGTVLSERGRASEALPRLAAAGRVFAELGATTESIAADLNRGNALLALGQIDDARQAAEAAIAKADGAPHLRAFAMLVAGDARRRLGDHAGAVALYRDALAIGVERRDAHAQISAHVALAEAGVRGGEDGEIEALCASQDDRDRWTIARGRLLLSEHAGRRVPLERSGLFANDSWQRADAGMLALARACAEVGARASDGDRLERAFRAYSVAARLAEREPAFARAQADRARAAHAALVASAAPAFRGALETDPDVAALAMLAPAAPIPQVIAREPQAPPLRRLLTLSRRLNSEASVERILDEVIDTAIELSNAERGFLLLRQPDGELSPVVSRNFLAGELDQRGAAAPVSRSIAERAAQTGEPVMTVDAGVDERFGAAASVAALRLRSVLVVPLRQRGTITGCIYVDHRLRGGAFDETAAAVLGELADIAAIAIENARLTADLRRTKDEVDQLNGRLSAELADKDAELTRVKADLPDRDRLRHRYERIVGRSAATVRMLDVVDRAAATSLPVVIVGESGTGKELVARALHDNGPRKDGPFVAINCSAVPEPLLESELFGHIRGSFTGADRDRRGLFEVADTGTLFLDEIADTSVAMQAKLLRVLQDGIVRRVGDTKTRKVDVRVVAATQHPLAELVAQGRFREDLRFRIEVIAIPMPALRDRDGDIPLLVERLLAQLCGTRTPPRLTRAAMRALGAHRWPGNVRELENALARGVAMGGDVIDVGDLPEAVAASAGRPEPAKPQLGEDLRLKPALTATEQAYISAAMSRAKNNQTVAARLLGLSRFGLQKKLRRLSGEDATDDDD